MLTWDIELECSIFLPYDQSVPGWPTDIGRILAQGIIRPTGAICSEMPTHHPRTSSRWAMSRQDSSRVECLQLLETLKCGHTNLQRLCDSASLPYQLHEGADEERNSRPGKDKRWIDTKGQKMGNPNECF